MMGTFTKPARDFADIPLVRNHIATAAKMVAQDAGEEFIQQVEQRLDMGIGDTVGDLTFDSPLEAVFWVWWRAAVETDLFCRENIELRRHVEVPLHGGDHYVIDFVVDLPSSAREYVHVGWPLIGVELDGHTFHEKTLEQVTYRNQRDRALQQAGWRIFHFSFAEFTQEPSSCLWEVVEFARAAYWQLVRKQAERHRAEAAAHKKEAAPVGDDAP